MNLLKSFFHQQEIHDKINELLTKALDKTNTGSQSLQGPISVGNSVISQYYTRAMSLISDDGNNHSFRMVELGIVNSTDLLSSKITAGQSGIYHFKVGSNQYIVFILFSSTNLCDFLCINPSSAGKIVYNNAGDFSTAVFTNIINGFYLSNAPIVKNNATSINVNLGGTPQYGVENSTLHISGTFTPTATIAAGTKLFSTGQILAARMTHDSAINSGTAGSETYVGISIQTNGDVYCLGALTAGVTYNIAVTATM